MTVSILTTFYDQQFVNKQSVSPTNTRSDQWSFERLRRADGGYWVAETCCQYSVFLTVN
jgi:hypothetical protein